MGAVGETVATDVLTPPDPAPLLAIVPDAHEDSHDDEEDDGEDEGGEEEEESDKDEGGEEEDEGGKDENEVFPPLKLPMRWRGFPRVRRESSPTSLTR